MKQKLIELIKKSSLNEEEKSQWEALILASPEEYAAGFLEIFENHPEEIVWFNNLLQRKKEAFKLIESQPQTGREILAAIYEEERQRLEKMLSS